MSIGLMLMFALLGMTLVAGVSFALYARLPRKALDLLEAHGRYAGLGARDAGRNRTSGHRQAAQVPVPQGQSV